MKLKLKTLFHPIYDEEKILLLGLVLILATLFIIFVISFFDRATAGKLFSIITTHLLTGRAGGISTGVELGIPLSLLALLSTVIDTSVVLVVYPLFIMISKRRIDSHLLHDVLSKTEMNAQKHKEKLRKYGLVGLLLFVWFPLHMTGPLAGSILGYFLGFSHRKTLLTVIVGTAFAVLSWLFIFQKLSMALGDLSFITPIIIILITIILYFVYRKNKNRKK